MKPIAYSYVRFSTAGQIKGDSLRRQVDACSEYCSANGLELHAYSYRDLGVSAFKRENIEKGALAAFMAAVKSGKIAPGSYLIIEQFDRLSRAEIPVALQLLLDLVQNGITLVTLVDKKVWDKESVNDIANLVLAIVFMSRANNESAAKSARLSAAWGQKKLRAAASNQILTRECPRWLRVNDDKTVFEVLEDRVGSIRKVFEMKIGGHGIVSIVSRANSEGWPAPGKQSTWHLSLVGRLLKNRALLGEYQPHKLVDSRRVPEGEPVHGFYPTIIDESLFLRAQAVADRRGAFPGRRDENSRNFLQGLLRCTCGRSFVRKNKTSAKQPDYARYYCTARVRGLSTCPSVGASELESAIIDAVLNVGPQFFSGVERASELKALADVQQVELTAALLRRDRYAEAIGTSDAPIPILMQRLNAARAEVDTLEKGLSVTRAQASESGGDRIQMFAKIARAIHTSGSVDERAELRENLSRMLLKCVVNAQTSTVELHVRGQENLIVAKIGDPKKEVGTKAELGTLVTDILKNMPAGHYEKMMRRLDQETTNIASTDKGVFNSEVVVK